MLKGIRYTKVKIEDMKQAKSVIRSWQSKTGNVEYVFTKKTPADVQKFFYIKFIRDCKQ